MATVGTLCGQLAISDSVQTYDTLTNTTVTMTGKSELHVTGTGNPISGSTIHLNSHDSWLWLDSVRPATAAGYLGQIKVNGATAVHGGNVRVVQYAMGTVITPFTNGEQPLETFTDPGFHGESKLYNLYTYYNSAGALGSMQGNISSFKLKRGFMATFATQPNGTGVSKVYVAQDHDVTIANLPGNLDNAVQFVRVIPWRWVSKKGSCDVSPDVLNAAWYYNWDNNSSSTLNWEYVPIKQQPYWPGNPTTKTSVTHWLGFNEPNNPVEDSYKNLNPQGSVDAAISLWPNMLSTGHRVGSPAVTDGGKGWLYSFMDKANAAGLRVDYIAIHNYQCGHSAASLKSWLEDIWNRYRKPIWLTEFNNGANWTNCGDPTPEQNAAVIGSFIDMMDSTPWIERYAVYSNVEWQRNMTWNASWSGSSGLTPAGAVYAAQQSPIGYQQELYPIAVERGVAQLPFDGNTRDVSGYDNRGITHGAPTFVAGQRGQALDLNGADRFVQLPAGIASNDAFTFAAWVNWDGGGNWQRIFDFGTGTGAYLFLTPSNGSNMRFAIKNGGAEQTLNAAPLPVGQWTHVAVTLGGGSAKIYVNGALAGTNNTITINPADIAANRNYLGKSQYPDPLFDGRLDEVMITDSVLSQTQITALMTNQWPQFTNATINGGTATQGVPYSGSLAGAVTDPGDTITFTKSSGPAWLVVATDGTLSGTPSFDDDGTQIFTVVATDTAGATAVAELTITLPVVIGNGTWLSNLDGTWSDTSKWSGGFRANGAGSIADFSTLNITGDRMVDLDTNRTIGSLKFGDTSGSQNWTLWSATNKALTMAATSPSIVVNQNTATVAVGLNGTAGLNKTGAGTLVLAGNSSISGVLNIDTGSTGANEGTVRLAHPGAAAAFSTIQIRTNNSGSSTLELDGASGSVNSPASVTINGRNNSVPAISNIGGSNTLAGTLSIFSGGSNYRIESNAGQLELAGNAPAAGRIAFTSGATGTRTLTLQGSGDGLVTGRIQNGSADAVSVVKSGTGSWALNGVNTYTGTTSVTQGELQVNGSTGTGSTTVSNGATLSGGGSVSAALTGQTGSTIRVGPAGFPMVQSLTKLDDFESYDNSTETKTSAIASPVWEAEFVGTGNAHIIDEGGGQVLQTNGGAAWRGNKTDLTQWNAGIGLGETATIFFQMKAVGSGTYSIMTGLSPSVASIDTTDAWADFAVMPYVDGVAGSTLAYRMNDAGLASNVIFNMNTDVWYNVWLVVDNAAQTYSVYHSTGTNDGTFGGTATKYWNGHGNTALIALGFMASGGSTTSLLVDNVYHLHGVNTSYPVGANGQLVPAEKTMHVAGDFSLAAGATLEVDVSTGSLHDNLKVGGHFTASGSLKVSLDPAQLAPVSGDSFDLFDAGSSTINFASLVLPTLTPGLEWDTSAIGSGVLSVTGVPEGYSAWVESHIFPPGMEAPTADANQNGMANVLEWLFGSEPVGSAAASPAWPKVGLQTVSGSEFAGADPSKRYLSLTATVRKSIPGWTLHAQTASSPALLDEPGSADGIVSLHLNDLGEFEERTWIHTQPIEENTAAFMRLKLTGE